MRSNDVPGRDARAEAILGQLGEAVGILRCASAQRLMRHGASMTHLYVLTLLHHHGPASMGRLAEMVGGSMSGATGIVDRMEERGLVERVRPREDRRVVLVRATDAGAAVLADMDLLRGDLFGRILDGLPEEDLAPVGRVVARLLALVREDLGEAADPWAADGLRDHASPPASAGPGRSAAPDPARAGS